MCKFSQNAWGQGGKKKDDLKIFGNPKLKLTKNIHIKNYLKDHRIFMMSCIAALSFGVTGKLMIKIQ